ncbi:POU domain, class 5, transcription factor 1.1-like [Rana temporaria]|uniref:POU domain, class 5, transcription factor 1.1-like n=1 Tax=Rana temporaria TaxID=8407 RepID=UPI001AAC99F0|nr:POU domain, class 5, transcription factor 1.1-like [Rana temporaria]
MYSQQVYPSFTPNHDIIPEGFEDYYHHCQAFFSPAAWPDNGDLGGHQAQVVAWNHAPQPEPPGHVNLCAPQTHQLNMETPWMVESQKIEESEDSDGSEEEEKSHPVLQYCPRDCTPAFWPGSPNFSSQTQKNANVPGSDLYPTPPNTPVETLAFNLESSCSTEEVAKGSDSLASQAMTSTGAQKKILSDKLKDTLEMLSEMEIEQFARNLKQKRLNMGFTQADVCYAMELLYGKAYSQTTICRFESFQLSYKNMCRIKPFLHRWLQDAENKESHQELIRQAQALAQSRKRKRRTGIDGFARESLETYFMNYPKPCPKELERIAEELHMEKDVVRVWFCNRRQKRRCLVLKELSNQGYEPQHIVHHVGVFSHQMPFPGYTSGSPPMYNPSFYHKNDMFQQPAPYGMQFGNQIF